MPDNYDSPLNESVSVDLTDSFDEDTEYDFEPLGNYLLVTMHQQEKVTKGGIILAENAVPKPNLATVTAAGPGQRSGLNGTLIEPTCKPGDVILVQPFGVTTIKFKGDMELSLISENDVLLRVFAKEDETMEQIAEGVDEFVKARADAGDPLS